MAKADEDREDLSPEDIKLQVPIRGGGISQA